MQGKKIAFIHPGSAYLPELEAYYTYFISHGFQIETFTKKEKFNLNNFDVEWHLMGTDFTPKVAGRLKIHEYTSLSLPPLAKMKNTIKCWSNTVPDLRIFLNTFIHKELNFTKEAPFLFRNAGVGAHFFDTSHHKSPVYDFVYLGSMHTTRRIEYLFSFFLQNFKNHTLLVIGDAPYDLQNKFRGSNIHFLGKIPYLKVPDYLRQATYGINYIPPRYPYYLQPSYKLLDYCACNLKIITTDYDWVNQFENEQGGAFFKINNNWDNFYPELITTHHYKTPDIKNLEWNNIIDKSKVLHFIQQYFAKD